MPRNRLIVLALACLSLGRLAAAEPVPARPAVTAPAAAPAAARAAAEVIEAPPGMQQMHIPAGTPEQIELGRRIYLEGIGEQGKKIVGLRFGGVEAEGAAVACVPCHRRSGLGAVEGVDQVQPIAGRFIFSDDPRALVSMNARNLKKFNQRHEPFSLASFADAMRGGRQVNGSELGPIMPRYVLTDNEVAGLAAYLRSLSAEWSPGVDRNLIRFATVITPEVDDARRKAFIDTIRAAVGQKNGSVVAHGQRTMSAAEMMLRTERRWDLSVWELQGPPDSWAKQLEDKYREQPVFALVSGLGDGTWEPVHEFCERQRVACWFPSVDLPPGRAAGDFYSVYFSRGVALEADVLSKSLEGAKTRPARIIQVHGGEPVGQGGAQALRSRLAGVKRPPKLEERVVAAGDSAALRRAVAKLGKKDALMLWLKPAELALLAELPPPPGEIYLSGYMANGEGAPLPAAWKQRARLIYPYQLPDKRGTGLMYFHNWLSIRKLPLVDEVMQSEVFFAMSYLGETLMDMLDNVHRDYLLERAESMLSLRESSKAEDEAREMSVAKHQLRGGAQSALERINTQQIKRMPRPMPGRAEHVFAKRESTTIYPRLGLAQGQRFASKGAYIVRFANAEGKELSAETDWLTP